jgi:nicotinate-nucleotide pyrophosphorylase (carboxylating)
MVERKIREFILEDLGYGDITTDSIIDKHIQARANVVCKERAVLAGLEEAKKVFTILDCTVELLERDGNDVNSGSIIMKVEGSGRAVLKGERTALNILMRMSGIATATRRILSKVKSKNPDLRIASTRKTAPGLRYFDKKAVEIGGGDTHRFRLDDCVLIKDNHIKLIGSVEKAVMKARKEVSFTKKVEVEVETNDQAIEAAKSGADIVMLDNMKPNEIQRVVKELEQRSLRKNVLIEVSGGITEENIKEYAEQGVDVISIGALTHSIRAININIEIEKLSEK